jgi:RNA polymerase sigma-70 factor (family 1)
MKLKGKVDETYWINALRQGDEQAFHWFFTLHNKSLCYFASKLLQDQLQAEEIVSDCFIKLWERQQNFETADNIKAFLYITCRNSCLKHLRDLKKKTAHQQMYLSHLETSEESVLYEIIDTEIITILGREIEELPDKCREVFNLIYLEGKKTDEIAVMLNISIQTVRNHKTRAVELLKTSILKKGLSHAIMLAFLLFIAD